MAPVSIPVLVNRNGGTAASRGDSLEDELKAAFAEAGLTIDLQLLDGGEIAGAVAKHVKAPLVVIGGGDGTLSGAARALLDAKAKTPLFGILPLGTRNHLARELCIPLDLPGAAKLIAERPVRQIDVARVNGELFVNNASVGLYPALVRRRDAARKRHGLPKWLAMLPATAGALANLRNDRLSLDMPEGTQSLKTPMLFVGNNRYALDAGEIGKRESLDAGQLAVYAIAPKSAPGLIAFALRTAIGRANTEFDFAAIGDMPAFTVNGAKARIDIALDGEVKYLDLPLRFEIQPRALAVVAPPA
jgi:diacylglycerol kinase family enzyme